MIAPAWQRRSRDNPRLSCLCLREAIVSIGLAIPVIVTFLERGVVPRLPTAVLSMGLMILAMLSVSSGLVLDTVTRGRREMKLLAYLVQPPLGNN